MLISTQNTVYLTPKTASGDCNLTWDGPSLGAASPAAPQLHSRGPLRHTLSWAQHQIWATTTHTCQQPSDLCLMQISDAAQPIAGPCHLLYGNKNTSSFWQQNHVFLPIFTHIKSYSSIIFYSLCLKMFLWFYSHFIIMTKNSVKSK